MSPKNQVSEHSAVSRNIRPVAMSVLFGGIVCAAVLLLLALVVSTQSVPQAMIDPMAIFALSVGAFVAGFSCAKAIRRGGLLCGIVCGAVFSLIMLICSLAVSDAGFGVPALFRIVFILLSSMLGGVLGVNTKKRRK